MKKPSAIHRAAGSTARGRRPHRRVGLVGLAIVTSYGRDSHVQFVACMCGCGTPMVEMREVEDTIDFNRFLITGIYHKERRA